MELELLLQRQHGVATSGQLLAILSRREDGWYNCNDGQVHRVGNDIPEANAAIMIYERIH